jgi:hypothetical protein
MISSVAFQLLVIANIFRTSNMHRSGITAHWTWYILVGENRSCIMRDVLVKNDWDDWKRVLFGQTRVDWSKLFQWNISTPTFLNCSLLSCAHRDPFPLERISCFGQVWKGPERRASFIKGESLDSREIFALDETLGLSFLIYKLYRVRLAVFRAMNWSVDYRLKTKLPGN